MRSFLTSTATNAPFIGICTFCESRPDWGSSNRILNGRCVCDSHHVNEDTQQRTYLAAIREMIEDADEIIVAVQDSARLVLQPENAAALAAVEQEIIAIEETALALYKAKQAHTVTDGEYTERISECSRRIKELEAQQAELQTAESRYAEVKVWLDTFEAHIKSGDIMTTDDDTIVKQLVEQIIVSDDGIEIQFKCGATIEKEYEAA